MNSQVSDTYLRAVTIGGQSSPCLAFVPGSGRSEMSSGVAISGFKDVAYNVQNIFMIFHGMDGSPERLKETEEIKKQLENILGCDVDWLTDDNSSHEEYESLEFEEIDPIAHITNAILLDGIGDEEDNNDYLLSPIEHKIYEWSDSDQSEIDFELPGKSPEENGKNKIKYIKVKSGNIVKKIRLNLNDISAYFDKVKRRENYKKFLKMIRQLVDKKAASGDQPPAVVTPDESELQGLTEEEKAQQRLIWQQELAKIEEEIQTLKHVLQSKQRDSQELKRKLGISVWKELTDDLSQGMKNVKESNVYQQVEEKFSQISKAVSDAPIYQKTESVMKAASESTRSILGGLTGGFTQKIGQLKNSESFKSFEEKVGSAYENVKTKVSSRSNSVQSFNEALREETANRNTNALSPTSPTIPEGKPLS